MMRNESKIISEKEQEYDFSSFVVMEDLLDKLKLLNYEEEFLKHLKMKPIHRFYFVIAKNPGEQFYIFALLAHFLIGKIGKGFPKPQEYDDPNVIVEKILTITQECGISVNFPPNKLKQGVGEHVVYILNNLANEALSKANFHWKRPEFLDEYEPETEIIQDESEINLNRVEEEMLTVYSEDSDEENLLILDNLKERKREFVITDSIVDEEAWKLELERILPQLKITVKNENRDWRFHLEQMLQLKATFNSAMIKGPLEKLHREIGSTLDKIGNREKYLNRELESVLVEYRKLQDQLSRIRDNYKELNGGVSERNREFAKLTDKLESVKQQMEEKGSSMTDGTPLVNIKKSVARIKTEIVNMDVRIGVLECILLQLKIRDEKILENEFGQTISVF